MMPRCIATIAILIAGSCFVPNSALLAEEKGVPGAVTFLFDGGTLECTFGRSNPDEVPHVAMVVFPASVDQFAKRYGTPIDKEQAGSIVLVSDENGKFVQLTRDTVHAWLKARVSDMAGRQTSVAENAFLAATMLTISAGMPVKIWASNAQEMLESGPWDKLF